MPILKLISKDDVTIMNHNITCTLSNGEQIDVSMTTEGDTVITYKDHAVLVATEDLIYEAIDLIDKEIGENL